MTDPSPSKTLADFAANLRFEVIPPAVIQRAQDLFLDWFGSALAGKGARPVEAIESFAKAMGRIAGVSEVLISRRRTSPFFAALVNGAASHFAEQDDVHNGSVFHPGTVVFPPALAVAQTLGNTGQDFLTGSANMPHPSGDLNVELRPWKRVRIVDFWMTDRLHNASSDLLTEILLFSTGPLSPSTLSNARLEESNNQQELDVFLDVTSRLTVRVGDRYIWGDARLTSPAIIQSPYESGHLSQNVGIGGLSYRAAQKTRVNVDYEVSESTQAYFSTSLRNYKKFRVRGSHDLTPSLRFAVDYSLLTNSNPDPTINYDFSTHAASLSLNWLPKGGKWVTALLDYTRSNVQSSITYLVPLTRAPATSLYHENAHTATALIGVKWFSAGGSFFISSGSRPTQYYQPLARVSVPVYKHVSWNAEWRYYGFAEQFYQFEGFRSNQLMTSLRLVR